jgi:hypothetical protein
LQFATTEKRQGQRLAGQQAAQAGQFRFASRQPRRDDLGATFAEKLDS